MSLAFRLCLTDLRECSSLCVAWGSFFFAQFDMHVWPAKINVIITDNSSVSGNNCDIFMLLKSRLRNEEENGKLIILGEKHLSVKL